MSAMSASASRVPCKNNIEMFTAKRCDARSSDGRPAACSGKPRKARPRTPQSLRLRGHASAKRLAAGDEREFRNEHRGFRHRGTHGGLCELRCIGALRVLLHIGKLVAQGGNAVSRESFGDRHHERMSHAGARAVREHTTRTCATRRKQQSRDAARLVDGDGHRLRGHGHLQKYPRHLSVTRAPFMGKGRAVVTLRATRNDASRLPISSRRRRSLIMRTTTPSSSTTGSVGKKLDRRPPPWCPADR